LLTFILLPAVFKTYNAIVTVEPPKGLKPVIPKQNYPVQTSLGKSQATQSSVRYFPDTSWPLVCVLARGYAGNVDTLPTFLLSLLVSQFNVHIVLVNTEYDFFMLEQWSNTINTFFPEPVVTVANISRSWTDSHFGHYRENFGPDYGYILTQVVLNDLLNRSSISGIPSYLTEKCKYILITNADNYYHYDLMGILALQIENGMDLIAFHFTSHHYQPNICAARARNAQCFTRFETSWIDLGAGVTSVNLLKEMTNHFVDLNSTKDQNLFAADGRYFERLSKMTTRKTVIREVLLVHQ